MTLRPRLLLATVPPFALVALLALAGVPGWLVGVAAGVAALGVAAGVVALTAPFERLRAGAAESLTQAGVREHGAVMSPVAGPADGTGEVSQAIAALIDHLTAARATLAEREAQYGAALVAVAGGFAAAAKDWRAAPEIRLESPWAGKNQSVTQALTQVTQTLGAAHRRAAALHGILNDIPDPVLVFDAKQATQFLNSAAERWFGHLPNRGLRLPLDRFLAEPPASEVGDYSASAPRPEDVIGWVNEGRGGTHEGVVATDDEEQVPVQLAAVAASGRRTGLVLLMRDLTESKKAEANLRHLHRRLVGQRMSLLVAREGTPALEAIRTQAGLLTQVAKQAGQRERFVPKVQRILEEVSRQELVIDQLGWLGRLTTTHGSESDVQEVRLRDVADEVARKLAPAFAERGNRLKVSGDAGWLLADEARMTTLVTGLLLHANQSCEQAEIALDLGRRSVVANADEMGEAILRYPGTAPSALLMGDIRDPFQRPNSGVFDSSGRLGFLLGLAVASRIAHMMGGELEVDGSAGAVAVRVVVPSRDRTENRTSGQASSTVDFTPGSAAADSLSDWLVGGAKDSGAEQETETARNASPAAAAVSTDDTAGDTLGSFFGPG